MRVHSTFEISRGEWIAFPPETQKHIRTALTYTNPKWLQASRLGFSTYGIPKEIQTFRFGEDGRVLIDRGEIRKVVNVLASLPMACEFQLDDTTHDRPADIVYRNDDFALDERQERCVQACFDNNQGIVHAATSAGKSAMMMALIGARKQRTLVVVNRKVLLEQLRRDAERWLGKEHIGVIADGKMKLGNVTFALEKSLMKHMEAARDHFGMVIMDECHIAPALSFQKIFHELPARYRYGFTGTVKRKDQMQFLMYAAFGPILETVTKDELEEADRVTPIRVQVHETNTSVDPEVFELDTVKRWREMERVIHSDDARHGDVCMLVEKLLENPVFEAKASVGNVEMAPGDVIPVEGGVASVIPAKIVVASRFLEPLERIGDILASNYPKIRFRYVTGEEKDQDANCQALEKGECDVILATIQCFSTGVNVPSLTDLILISPVFTNELVLHQLRGRLMRKSEGKAVGTFHFMFDSNIFDQKKLIQFLSILKR